jgi:Flp pilus assembly protein TadD
MLRSKAVLLGSEANEKAQSGHHKNAIQLFSKAIHLFPFDYRFYMNRAFCYEKTELSYITWH